MNLVPETPGLQLLEAWFRADPKRRTPTRLARAIGVRAPAVFQYRARKARPDHSVRPLICRVTGVAEEAWETEEERVERIERELAADCARKDFTTSTTAA